MKKISQVVGEYQVTFRALRFYEDKGLLSPVRQGSARIYTATDLSRLELILKGKHLGFTLSEIAKIITASAKTDSSPPQSILDRISVEQLELQRERLTRQKMNLDAAIQELEEALNVDGGAARRRA